MFESITKNSRAGRSVDMATRLPDMVVSEAMETARTDQTPTVVAMEVTTTLLLLTPVPV